MYCSCAASLLLPLLRCQPPHCSDHFCLFTAFFLHEQCNTASVQRTIALLSSRTIWCWNSIAAIALLLSLLTLDCVCALLLCSAPSALLASLCCQPPHCSDHFCLFTAFFLHEQCNTASVQRTIALLSSRTIWCWNSIAAIALLLSLLTLDCVCALLLCSAPSALLASLCCLLANLVFCARPVTIASFRCQQLRPLLSSPLLSRAVPHVFPLRSSLLAPRDHGAGFMTLEAESTAAAVSEAVRQSVLSRISLSSSSGAGGSWKRMAMRLTSDRHNALTHPPRQHRREIVRKHTTTVARAATGRFDEGSSSVAQGSSVSRDHPCWMNAATIGLEEERCAGWMLRHRVFPNIIVMSAATATSMVCLASLAF